MTDETLCLVCKERLNKYSRKCTHCGSYQNWRRYFDISSVVLSLLVALISVLTAAVPVMKSTFEAKKSDIRFSFVMYRGNKIRVVSSNLGPRPGVLKTATLEVFRDNKRETLEKLSFDEHNLIIGPGKSQVFDLYLPDKNNEAEGLPLGVSAGQSCEYLVEFGIIAFDHKPKKPRIKFPCPSR